MAFRRILVTGAAGFLGSRLADSLAAGHPDAEVIRGVRGNPDLSSPRAADKFLAKHRPDAIFHCAGRVFSPDATHSPDSLNSLDTWSSFYRDNVEATLSLLDAVAAQDAGTRVVIAGSAAEYGAQPAEHAIWTEDLLPRPVSPYGVSKAWQTTAALHAASRGLNVVVARVFNFLGEGISDRYAPGRFAAQLRELSQAPDAERVIQAGHCGTKRDFVDVRDACAALLAIAEHGRAGQIYNVASGRTISIRDLLEAMIRITDVGSVKILEDSSPRKPHDLAVACGSPVKTRSETGWQATVPLDASLKALLGV